MFGNFGSGKGRDNVWAGRVGVGETSITEVRGIGREDIDTEDHACEPHRREYLDQWSVDGQTGDGLSGESTHL